MPEIKKFLGHKFSHNSYVYTTHRIEIHTEGKQTILVLIEAYIYVRLTFSPLFHDIHTLTGSQYWYCFACNPTRFLLVVTSSCLSPFRFSCIFLHRTTTVMALMWLLGLLYSATGLLLKKILLCWKESWMLHKSRKFYTIVQ